MLLSRSRLHMLLKEPGHWVASHIPWVKDVGEVVPQREPELSAKRKGCELKATGLQEVCSPVVRTLLSLPRAQVQYLGGRN